MQVVTVRVGLSKLSSVTWPCVERGRTQSNLPILIRLSAAGDCEAPWETLETGERPVIYLLRVTGYRRPNSILWDFRCERKWGGGADVVERIGRRIRWCKIDPKHNRFRADDGMGLGVGYRLRLAFSYPCERVGGFFG